MTKLIPSIEPQFHMYEIEVGVGNTISVDLIVLIRGWGAIIFFIYLDVLSPLKLTMEALGMIEPIMTIIMITVASVLIFFSNLW